MKKTFYSYVDMKNDLHEIIRQMSTMEHVPYVPDYVVGITRGGLMPATHLSHYLGKPLETIHISLRDNANATLDTTAKASIFSRLLHLNHWGKKLLIVDDIVDDGKTMRLIAEELKVRDLNRYAVLHYNIGQKNFEPDFYAREINKNEDPVWIVYEWEEWHCHH